MGYDTRPFLHRNKQRATVLSEHVELAGWLKTKQAFVASALVGVNQTCHGCACVSFEKSPAPGPGDVFQLKLECSRSMGCADSQMHERRMKEEQERVRVAAKLKEQQEQEAHERRLKAIEEAEIAELAKFTQTAALTGLAEF